MIKLLIILGSLFLLVRTANYIRQGLYTRGPRLTPREEQHVYEKGLNFTGDDWNDD